MRTKKRIKRTVRARKKLRLRKILKGSDERPRLSVFRSNKYIYAQVISDQSGNTLASASSKDSDIIGSIAKEEIKDSHSKSKSTKSLAAAQLVGKKIADKCNEKGISSVVFDRNGYVFHGRVKAIADGARANGLKF